MDLDRLLQRLRALLPRSHFAVLGQLLVLIVWLSAGHGAGAFLMRGERSERGGILWSAVNYLPLWYRSGVSGVVTRRKPPHAGILKRPIVCRSP